MSVGPLAEGGLDEAFCFAVSARGVGPSEAMFEAEGGDGGGHGVRAVGGAIIGVDALRVDAVFCKRARRGHWLKVVIHELLMAKDGLGPKENRLPRPASSRKIRNGTILMMLSEIQEWQTTLTI